jgi:hypothetical protein
VELTSEVERLLPGQEALGDHNQEPPRSSIHLNESKEGSTNLHPDGFTFDSKALQHNPSLKHHLEESKICCRGQVKRIGSVPAPICAFAVAPVLKFNQILR